MVRFTVNEKEALRGMVDNKMGRIRLSYLRLGRDFCRVLKHKINLWIKEDEKGEHEQLKSAAA